MTFFSEVPFTLFIFKSKKNAFGTLLFVSIVSLRSIFLFCQTGFAITLTLSPLFFSTQKNTIQAFMGVSLISIFVAVDVEMLFLR